MRTVRLKAPISDHVLVEKIRNGDRYAFEVIFDRYFQSLRQFARRELKADELVDDVVQDVFVSLWVNRQRLKSGETIKGFLFTCLKHQILNAIRTQKNIVLKHTKFVEQKVYASAPVENDMILAEYNLAVSNFILTIPKSKQRILELNMLGYKNKEISQQVNLSTNTVKMYLSDLKRSIKTFILDSKTFITFLLVSLFVG